MTTAAWYVVPSKRPWARWFNTLHWPYTLWHLSYVAIGAALADQVNWALLGWTMVAFFLGMGVAPTVMTCSRVTRCVCASGRSCSERSEGPQWAVPH